MQQGILSRMKVDIVCPLYNAETIIDGFLQRIEQQKNIEIVDAVFPVTKSEGYERVIQKLQDKGCKYFIVEPEDFSHSLTREKAIFEYCTSDIVVMISQDVILCNDDSIYLLANALSDEIVYAYGRQICKKKTIEHYIREKNYGKESALVSKDDIERLQLSAFFSSDAFAAYYRPTFIKLNGYDNIHMMMSEDMYYAKKLIESGYKKAYVAEAVVEHSHKLTLKQLYKRYYATGIWFAEHKEFDNYKTTDSGLSLAIYVFKAALKNFNIPVLLRFLPDMSARYLGMRKGKRKQSEENAK